MSSNSNAPSSSTPTLPLEALTAYLRAQGLAGDEPL